MWRLVFCSSEGTRAFVFQSVRNNLQRCEIIHQSQHHNFCWLLHTLCIFIIPLFPPQLFWAAVIICHPYCPSFSNNSGNKNTNTTVFKQLLFTFRPVSAAFSALQLLSGVIRAEFCDGGLVELPLLSLNLRKSTKHWLLFDQDVSVRCWSLQICAVGVNSPQLQLFFQSHSAGFGSITSIKCGCSFAKVR